MKHRTQNKSWVYMKVNMLSCFLPVYKNLISSDRSKQCSLMLGFFSYTRHKVKLTRHPGISRRSNAINQHAARLCYIVIVQDVYKKHLENVFIKLRNYINFYVILECKILIKWYSLEVTHCYA